jgi:uncharacterized protein YjbI with pentapeptide repeats
MDKYSERKWKYLSFVLMGILAAGSVGLLVPQASAHITNNAAHMAEHIYNFVDGIEAKTNNLPSDPASQAAVQASIDAAKLSINAHTDATIASIPEGITQAQYQTLKCNSAIIRPQIDLSGCFLSNADLRNSDLAGANLAGAHLGGVNLSNSRLWGAVLQGAHLVEANFAGSDFEAADLRNANLEIADLTDAQLPRANLSGANLVDANLSNTNLEEADFTGADITGVNFTGCSGTPIGITNPCTP